MFNEQDYLDLICSIVPKPIESEEELERFIQICESLAKKRDKSLEEIAIYNLLAILIVQYEQEQQKDDKSNPIELLKELMEDLGDTVENLDSVLGTKGLTEKILKNYYPIDLCIAKKLGKYFSIRYAVTYKDFL